MVGRHFALADNRYFHTKKGRICPQNYKRFQTKETDARAWHRIGGNGLFLPVPAAMLAYSRRGGERAKLPYKQDFLEYFPVRRVYIADILEFFPV